MVQGEREVFYGCADCICKMPIFDTLSAHAMTTPGVIFPCNIVDVLQ